MSEVRRSLLAVGRGHAVAVKAREPIPCAWRAVHQITSHFTLRHGLASVAGHRRLCMQSCQGNGGGHAFAALSVGSRRVVNNQNVMRK